MSNEALKAIETLKFEAAKHDPAFDISVRKYRTYNAADGLDFQVSVYGDGFEASRNLNCDELLMIREWIDAALEAAATKRVA